MTYSLELRQHIFKVKQKEGLTFEETAARFHVSVRTLFRWEQRLEPQTTHKKQSRKIDLEALAKHVQEEPECYQRERAACFGVSQPSIWAALKELNISYKKTLAHPKANDELRKRFREKIAAYEQAGRPIAYLDESGFSQQMPRTHGYSLIGERCLGTHDWHAKGRINVIGAIVGFTFSALLI